MTWLVYALVGICIWSATAVADRYFLLKHVQNKRFYLVIPALLQFALVVLLTPFVEIPHATTQTIVYALLSGMAEAVFLYYLYIAVSQEEVSRVFPLTSMGPVLTLILGWLFLGEALSSHQLLAFFLFVLGGLSLSIKINDENKAYGFGRGLKPIVLGSSLSAIFAILLKTAFVQSDFWTGFFYSRLGFFIAGICILIKWREEIVREWRRIPPMARVGIIANQAAAFSGHLFYFLAISIASVALVQSSLSIQSSIVFLMAIAVSFYKPDLIGESIKKKDLVQKCAGVVLIVAATALLNF